MSMIQQEVLSRLSVGSSAAKIIGGEDGVSH